VETCPDLGSSHTTSVIASRSTVDNAKDERSVNDLVAAVHTAAPEESNFVELFQTSLLTAVCASVDKANELLSVNALVEFAHTECEPTSQAAVLIVKVLIAPELKAAELIAPALKAKEDIAPLDILTDENQPELNAALDNM
jgi:hypothetical protein